MPATALIKLTQGATVGGDGHALFGSAGTAVNVANVSNTGVGSWEVELLSVPIASALTPGILASSNNGSTPAAAFTPDARGAYRLRLRVWSGQNRAGDPADTDIRVFGVKEANGYFVPAPQLWPAALPPVASGLVGAKPDEHNFAGQASGWSGTGSDGLVGGALKKVDELAGRGFVPVADWNVLRMRVFAVDFVSGNDANLGYADPAGTSSADYQAACAAAGLVAKKTFPGLGAIFPRDGNGRLAEIVIANGGVNTEQLYAGSLADFLAGVHGYGVGCPLVRGTGTNTTAGVTKFDGTAADVDYQGQITAPGCNAAGYNPTGTPSATSVQCLKVGGGAAAIPAMPAAPWGARQRFDANTPTVALRNVIRQVTQVSGTDTLVPHAAWPATPKTAGDPGGPDVFYLEYPGYAFGTTSLGGGGWNPSTSAQICGGRCTGTLSLKDGAFSFKASVTNLLSVTSGGVNELTTTQNLVHPVHGTRIIGGGLRAETSAGVSTANAQNVSGLVAGTTLTFFKTTALSLGVGGGAGTSISIQNCNLQAGSDVNTAPDVGSATALGAPRFQRALITGSRVQIGGCVFEGAGANPAMTVRGHCVLTFNQGVPSGSAGNNDVGMDVSGARGSTIVLASTPTVTGALGDVRLAGGSIVPWSALAATGIVDIAGNRILGTSGNTPMAPIPFSGTLSGSSEATFSYLAHAGFNFASNAETPLRIPFSQRILTRLRVYVASNTFTGDITVRLYKNGAATTMVVTIPASQTGKFLDVSHPTLFLDGDDYDIRADSPVADDGGFAEFSGVVEAAA